MTRSVQSPEAGAVSDAEPAPPAPTPDGRAGPDTTRALRGRLVGTIVLAAPVVAVSTVPALQFTYWQWIALALTAPVVAWGGWPFHRAAWTNLRHGTATADTLISVATVAALGWSLYALLFGTAGVPGMTQPFTLTAAPTDAAGTIHLDVAAGVTAFVLAGRYAEARSRRRCGAALRALLDPGAQDVAVVRDGRETRLPVAELAVGDRFVVRPGERIAADGVVAEGTSAVDLATVTGESVPREVGPGDAVVGGCVNAGGRLVLRATRVGADTQLARTARLVEDAQSGEAGAQRLADRVSGGLVPVVITLAVATLGFRLGTGAPTATAVAAAVAVLVIACPGALGLATPTALLAGTGRGAQLGVLIRGPEVLESARRVDTVVLDRTGTVTTGVLALVAVRPADGLTEDEVLRIAGAVEDASEHPVGRAIAAAARERLGDLPAVAEFDSHGGLGVRGLVAEVDGEGPDARVVAHAVLVGRIGLLAEHDIDLPPELVAARDETEAAGRTAVLVAWDGVARGVLAVADELEPTGVEAVRGLRELGLRPVLLTGDNTAVARAVAAQVGVDADDVVAEAAPEDKVATVRRLRDEGRVVAVIGDGVDDAAALAAADLGVALGPDAIGASDLTLVRGDLLAAVDAVRLARRTLATVRGNLVWAFAYNAAALPLAAAGLVDPIVAGAAMASTPVFVVLNSLRLRGFRSAVGTR